MSRFQQILLFSLLSTQVLIVNLAQAQYDELGATNRMFYYSGYLGSTEKVEFNLQINGPTVSGSYIIERTGGLFTFSGRMASDKSGIGLIIFDEENQFVATIEAKLVSEDNNFAKEIKGRWKSSDGKRQVNLNLKKVAELASINTDNSPSLYGFSSQNDLDQLIAGFRPLDEYPDSPNETGNTPLGLSTIKKCYLKEIIEIPEIQRLGGK